MPRMTREEMDRYDREMMGIMNPQAAMPAAMPQASPPLNDPEGRPLTREYSLDDIRRFLGFGPRPAMSPAEAADAAQMYERVPNRALPPTPPRDYDAPSPSIPYMPSTDPRGAAAPIPPPPLPVGSRPSAPVRRQAPIMRGLPTNEADFTPPRINTLGGVSPADMAAMGQTAPALQPAPAPAPAPVPAPVPIVEAPAPAPVAAAQRPNRFSPQALAEALRRRDEAARRSILQNPLVPLPFQGF